MDRNARNVVYFHGMPGSPDELAFFSAEARRTWFALDRGQLPAGLTAGERFDRLAAIVAGRAREEPVRIVAFSLGAFVALEVASRLPSAPLSLDLMSPAAPLQLGAFLDQMAGRAVFSLAARRPSAFRMLARAQSLAATWMPGLLVPALFASAKGRDVELRSNPAFRTCVAKALQSGLGGGRDNYVCEVEAYVRDWSSILRTVRHPVTVWQGDADNWTPRAMAEALARALPNVLAVHTSPGLSHYSTLGEAVRRLEPCAVESQAD
jgi:pimeloyl-ACP methyl ester carboxylesterase